MNKLPNFLKGKWIELKYSQHSLDRLQERCKGCLQLKPSVVKLTNNNVLKWYKDENKHVELKVSLNYSRQENMILILQMDGVVKTLYFENKKRSYEKIQKKAISN